MRNEIQPKGHFLIFNFGQDKVIGRLWQVLKFKESLFTKISSSSTLYSEGRFYEESNVQRNVIYYDDTWFYSN